MESKRVGSQPSPPARSDPHRHRRLRMGATRGGPMEEIRPGDVVWFSPGEMHWHGATPITTAWRLGATGQFRAIPAITVLRASGSRIARVRFFTRKSPPNLNLFLE